MGQCIQLPWMESGLPGCEKTWECLFPGLTGRDQREEAQSLEGACVRMGPTSVPLRCVTPLPRVLGHCRCHHS